MKITAGILRKLERLAEACDSSTDTGDCSLCEFAVIDACLFYDEVGFYPHQLVDRGDDD
jgi:hypothetical protein